MSHTPHTAAPGVLSLSPGWWLLLLLPAWGCDGCRQTPDETAPPVVDDTADTSDSSAPDDTDTDTDTGTEALPGEPDFLCPDLDALPERDIEVVVEERTELQGHGWTITLETEQPELATVFFAPDMGMGPCLNAISTGWYQREHSLELSNLRLGTDYVMVVSLLDQSGTLTRTRVIPISTGEPVQTIPSGFDRLGIHGGTVWFDAELFGPVPGDVNIATSIGLCGVDFGSPSMGSQALLLDSEGFLVGNYVASDEVQGYAQVHATITGSPGYAGGNEDLRLHIGGGIPNQARVATMDLLGGVDLGVEQPSISANNYAMNYMDWVLPDTAALEDLGIHFEGTAHLAILSRNEDFQARSEVVFWDEGLVTDDNAGDPEAWTVWGYQTQEMSTHADIFTYANSAYYDPVRAEVVTHSHQAQGGIIWGVSVAEQRLVWVFGYGTSELAGTIPEDTIVISEIADPGQCDQPFFSRGHRVSAWHADDQGPESFFVSVHDNGGSEDDLHQHTRAMVYHLEIDDDAGTGSARVHWAFPSNPLAADDPLFDVMSYHNYVYGGLSKVPNHDDLFLMTSGTGYCYEDVNEQGMPTREQMMLLRAIPAQQTAELLAVYTPGSDDFEHVSLYAADPAQLYARIGQSPPNSGRRSFEFAIDE
jgi:hypothetical protein